MAWFKDWFNSPYYHILYGKRDEKEAELVVGNLLDFLKPKAESVFLDLACGKGRHTRQIASKGFEAYGVDLSEESIKEAEEFAGDHLHFEVHDMRKPYKAEFFDYILNLFTSFGYFKQYTDNEETICSVSKGLKTGGIFVQDYFNASRIPACLIPHEVKTIEGITFEISKKIENGNIIKDIRFSDHGEQYHFSERVTLFELHDFIRLYSENGLELIHHFGDYSLNTFDPQTSDRLILISRKK